MAAWVTPTTHATGDVLSVSDWNAVANNEIFLYQAPYGMYYNSASVSVSTGVLTKVTLDGVTAAAYGASVSSGWANFSTYGMYHVSGTVTMQAGAGAASNYLNAQVKNNGAVVFIGNSNNPNSTFPASTVSGIATYISGQTGNNGIGLQVIQNSGSTMFTSPVEVQTYLHAFFIGSQ